jgi:hypothetical protein
MEPAMPTEPKKPPIVAHLAWFDEWARRPNREEIAVAIAVRAGLRVAPLAARVARKGLRPQQRRQLSQLASLIFRAVTSARASAQYYPNQIYDLSAIAAAGAAANSTVLAIVAAEGARAAMFAASAAANSAAAAGAANLADARAAASAAVRAFADAFAAVDHSTAKGRA